MKHVNMFRIEMDRRLTRTRGGQGGDKIGENTDSNSDDDEEDQGNCLLYTISD